MNMESGCTHGEHAFRFALNGIKYGCTQWAGMKISSMAIYSFGWDANFDWHPNIHIKQNHPVHNDAPWFIMESYLECHHSPRLFLLDKQELLIFLITTMILQGLTMMVLVLVYKDFRIHLVLRWHVQVKTNEPGNLQRENNAHKSKESGSTHSAWVLRW